MLGFVKIAGLSAVLSAGVVSAFEAPRAPERATVAQKFVDRLPQSGGEAAVRKAWIETTGSATLARETKSTAGKGNPQRSIAAGCAGQTWPHIPHDCLISADGRPVRQAARTITVEERWDGERTSMLVRVPPTELAHR